MFAEINDDCCLIIRMNNNARTSWKYFSSNNNTISVCLLLVGCCLLCCTEFANGAYSFPPQELLALHALYSSTDGPNWSWNKPYNLIGYPWNFSNPFANPCVENWQGVKCSSNCQTTPCLTVSLELPSHRLVGTIPPELHYLNFLATLDLDTNHITGVIPFQLGNLSSLSSLDLYTNHLSGTIPSEIGKLTSLVNLALSYNFLSGEIPPELGNLGLLENMFLQYNRLSQSVSPEFGRLIQLRGLELYQNMLTGAIPAQLGNLTLLSDFALSLNQLTGTIPQQLSNMESLLYMYLENNHLSGSIPPEFGMLHHLEHLHLSKNKLSSSLPIEFCNMKVLQHMELFDNKLTGTIPPEWGCFTQLEIFALSINLLTSTLPAELGSMKSLQLLELDTNFLSGEIPSQFGSLSSLQNLRLYENRISGTIPVQLANLSLLMHLELYENYLSGSLPIQLGRLRFLSDIEIQINQLSGEIPSELGDLKLLTFLVLNINYLSGTIPTQLGNLTSLQYLLLYENVLSGTIPQQMCGLESLRTLFLSTNCFSGSIPTQVENMKLLQSLDWSVNHLSSKLPSLFGRGLEILILYSNKLTGPIPDTLGLLTNLSQIYLYDNQLTGSISPTLFSNVSLIQSFVVSQNCLTGSIPTSICSSKNLTNLVLDGMGTAYNCRRKLFPGTDNQAYYLPTGKVPDATIPTCVLELPNIRELHLSGLLLAGNIPNVSSLPTSLQLLSLSNNQLTGTIPNCYFLHSWEELDLSFNRLNGFVSTDFISLRNSTSISLQINRLSGNVASSIRSLEKVNILDGNMFTCNYDSGKLPKYDPSVNSYLCGSDSVNASCFVWMACAVICVLLLATTDKMFWSKSVKIVAMLSESSRDTEIDKYCDLHSGLLRLFGQLALNCIVLMAVYAMLKSQNEFKTYSNQYAWLFSSCFLSGMIPSIVLFVLWNFMLVTTLCIQIADSNFKRFQVIVPWRDLILSAAIVVLVSCVNGAYVYGLQQNLSTLYQALMTISLALFKVMSANLTQSLFRRSFSSKLILLCLLVYCQIIAPYLGELFVSTNCFYYAVVQQSPTVKYIVPFEDCSVLGTPNSPEVCRVIRSQSSYNPPFIYSYTCSSSLITSFSYVFVLRYAWVWLTMPLQQYLRSAKYYECVGRLTHVIDYLTKYDFMADTIIITLLVDLAVLLTFGVLFPPLAVIIFFTATLHLVQNRIHLRYLASRDTANSREQLACVNADEQELTSLVATSLPCLTILAAWFWSFTLFDTMGNAVGAAKASSMLVAMCLCPFLWLGMFWWIKRNKRPTTVVETEMHKSPLFPLEIDITQSASHCSS